MPIYKYSLRFSSLTEAKLYLKIFKFLFLSMSIEYPDHIISQRGVEPDQTKIDAMVN